MPKKSKNGSKEKKRVKIIGGKKYFLAGSPTTPNAKKEIKRLKKFNENKNGVKSVSIRSFKGIDRGTRDVYVRNEYY